MKEILFEGRKVPVMYEPDVLVVGSGMTGIVLPSQRQKKEKVYCFWSRAVNWEEISLEVLSVLLMDTLPTIMAIIPC